jgi:hypothetical protein
VHDLVARPVGQAGDPAEVVDAAPRAACSAERVLLGDDVLDGFDPGNPAIARYAEAARLITGDPNASIMDGVDWLRMTVDRLRVPRLAAFGIGSDMADDIAAKAAAASSTQGNPIALTMDELRAALADAM